MPKIAATGAPGSGKTTLMKMLSQAFALPHVESPIRKTVAEAGLVERIDQAPPHDRSYLQWEILIAQIAAESRYPSYFADRSVGDYLVYWERNVPPPHLRAFADYMTVVKRHMWRYDAILLLPLNPDGVTPEPGRIHEDPERFDHAIREWLKTFGVWDRVIEIKADGPHERSVEALEALIDRQVFGVHFAGLARAAGLAQ